MGQECTNAQYTIEPYVQDEFPKKSSNLFAKRNSLITPTPGTCGTVFRKKNRVSVHCETTHKLHEVPYSETTRLEDFLICLADLFRQPIEFICICHRQVKYSMKCKAYTQRTLKELGIEDNDILLLVNNEQKTMQDVTNNRVKAIGVKPQKIPVINRKPKEVYMDPFSIDFRVYAVPDVLAAKHI